MADEVKAEPYVLYDQFRLDNLKLRLDKMPLDGSVQCVISNTGTKSARQHGLIWMWATDVAESGMGSYDTKEAVYLAAKQRWVIPIMTRDNPFFADLYTIYRQLYAGDIDKMTWFAEHQVSTANLSVSQMAEVLTEFQRFYSGHGVPLRDPDDKKLLEWRK